MQAEAQRAKTEIEASLTIAAARPRDEKRCLDEILVTCQRPGVAEHAEYEYSRGGTAITGPTIKLLEVVAQKWGNLSFGFRELARHPGTAGQPGESIVEAFAWDLQSNARRQVQFSVPHAMAAHGKRKVLSDDRDIYEYIANMAQRRVRTCLENIIPRDIVDAAVEECRKTLHATIKIGPTTIRQLLERFTTIGVGKEMLEKRIQRNIESVTAAQILSLGRIFASIQDGMSEPRDWFDVTTPEPAKTAAEMAKDALRKQAPSPKAKEPPPEPQPADEMAAAQAQLRSEYGELIDQCTTPAEVTEWERHVASNAQANDATKLWVIDACGQKREALRGAAKPRRGKQQSMLPEGASATEQGI